MQTSDDILTLDCIQNSTLPLVRGIDVALFWKATQSGRFVRLVGVGIAEIESPLFMWNQ